ncbi:peptidase M24 [Litorimonas cladophorae]|uniref:Peptidase M24 n=1 Tax=Litorimonas cladophorae TaxID=1220491 RepID=A0A918KD92_9PROT|nr:M23 family metallopeptidase [Litorimonas cladophorae]GGX59241.1 peptidase M24 [Litorimonas cladophorae]
MINDMIGDVRSYVLRHFPERQIYLRSGGEVKYYVLSTRLQLAVVSGLTVMALWCLFTMINLVVGHNPLRSSSQQMNLDKANFERMLADSRAKEENTRLMLAEQRTNFETMARQIEEKHQTLAQMMGNQSFPVVPAGPDAVEYADGRVLMSPTARDATPRQSRRNIVKTASLSTGLGLDLDNSLNTLGETQDAYLISAERETLDRIERNRALIQSTDMDVETVLSEAGFGKGGPYIPVEGLITDTTGFVSRVSAIQARAAEAEALNSAIVSLPLGHPVGAETYRTSTFGLRQDPFTKRPTMHHGLDFGGQRNTPIVATADGVVIRAGRNGAYGKFVEIDHGYGFKTRYAHMHKTFVKRGQTVEKGTKIGGMGTTGRSTATHLHYEVHFQGRAYDPNKFLKAGLYVQ